MKAKKRVLKATLTWVLEVFAIAALTVLINDLVHYVRGGTPSYFDTFLMAISAGFLAMAGKELWRWHRVRSIQTTPIRQIERGLVEVVGTLTGVGEEFTHPSFIGGTPCLFSRLIVEEYRTTSKKGRWVELGHEDWGVLALVEDGTGRVLVDTQEWSVEGVTLAFNRTAVQGLVRDLSKDGPTRSPDSIDDQQRHEFLSLWPREGVYYDLGVEGDVVDPHHHDRRIRELCLVDGAPFYFLGRAEPVGIDAPYGVAWRLVPAHGGIQTLIGDRSLDKPLGRHLRKALLLGLIGLLALALVLSLGFFWAMG